MDSIRAAVLSVALLAAQAAGLDAAQPDAAPPEDFLTGQLLVASPDMGDPRFVHAVILVVHHDRDGAFGIVINRPADTQSLAALLDDLGETGAGVSGSVPVFAGGPMDRRIGFVVHSADYHRPETMPVDDKVAVTSSPAVLRDIAGKKGPRRFLVAFGYAGWGPGQLESELAQQAWFTAPDDPMLLFDADRQTLWDEALSRRERSL
jgi:putative transcriptional regulator